MDRLPDARSLPLLCALSFAAPAALGLGLGMLGAGCNPAPPPLYGEVATEPESMTPAPDMAMPAYPSGPYGNKKNQTLADIQLAGYRMAPGHTDVDALTWDTTISLGEYHANPACKCLLITWGALWCPACQQEQPALVRDVNGDSSFCVLNIVQEGDNEGSAATMDDVHKWAKRYQQNYNVVQGTRQTEKLFNGWTQGNPPAIGLPFSFIVKPDTMQVLDNVQGFDPDIHSNAMALCGD